MKLLIYPAVDEQRLLQMKAVAPNLSLINTDDLRTAEKEIIDADAFFGKITPELLAAAGQLQWIQTPTASLEHYLFPELTEHPCQLSNMRGLFYDVIADHVMAMVLCFARNLHIYLRQQQHAKWAPVGGEEDRSSFVHGPCEVSGFDRTHQHLSDYTIGVVGVGSIGSEICRRAAAFGMTLLGVDPKCRSLPGLIEDVWPVDQLSSLLEESDYVVIAAPHTPETEKMFRLEQFRQMKASAILINIGRGAIVDSADLTTALYDNLIAGAGLDVFEEEPLPASHPLWQMENVIITPHIAAASPKIAERHLETLLENVRRFAAGEEPGNLVNKAMWF